MHSLFARYLRNIPRMNTSAKWGLRFASSSFILRVPPVSAPRESPTPLVFVSATSWDESLDRMTLTSAMLAEKGFTCVQTDLNIPESSKNNSQSMMTDYESELSSAIRLSTIPFPPVIIARGTACLIAQTYISSNPASGMILLSPPVSNAELVESSKLPTPLVEFDFEPNFPIAVIASPEEVERLREGNRICQCQNVDVISVKDMDEAQTFVQIELWLDKLGI